MSNSQSVLTFDGNDSVNFGKKPEFKIDKNITLEAWIKSKTNTRYTGIVSNIYDTGSTESGYGILLDGKSGVYFGLRIPPQHIYYLSSGSDTLKLNQWHHVACTYDGEEMKIYIDGIVKATQNISGSSINYNPENDLLIGMYKDNNETYPFKGQIAEVRIWDKARTEAEIKADMNRRLTGKENGLVAYYPLNGDVLDHSSNDNNGTIQGNPTWASEDLDFLQPSYTKDVVISDLFTKGDRKKAQADEYIEIANNTSSPADISGWQIIALKVHKVRFIFPANTILEAGKSFRVYTNEYHPETGGFSFGFHTQMFKDSGEEAQLLDLEGNLISKFAY